MNKPPYALLPLLIATALPAHAAPVGSSCEPLRASVARMLDLYSRKDAPAVAGLLDGQQVLVLGSDISEVADTRAKVDELLADDFALWNSASFGAPAFMNCRVQGELATAAFDAPFEMKRPDGQAMKVTVRFLTVWRATADGWRLTQSMNSTPTVGASARELRQKR